MGIVRGVSSCHMITISGILLKWAYLGDLCLGDRDGATENQILVVYVKDLLFCFLNKHLELLIFFFNGPLWVGV